MRKYIAEGVGTFLLVFIGTLAAAKSQGDALIIALAFGGTLAMVVALLGAVSDELWVPHVNPAVSLGAWFHGSLSSHDLVPYWIAQFMGAIAGSASVLVVVGGGLSLGETTFTRVTSEGAFIVEAVLTLIFVSIVLLVGKKTLKQTALLIGGAFFIAHLVAVPLTGAGLNPARSMAPLVFSEHTLALQQLWVYVAGPFLGGAVAGILARYLKFN